MRALFPTAHAVRKQSVLPDKTLTTCYDGIRFTDDSDKQCIATENVATFIQSTVPICICHIISESVIKVYMESDIFCNDMPIMKSAYLNVEHGTWAMFVGKKEISLPENNIDPHFSLHTNSVSTVLFFLINFKVCMGKMASGDVTTRQLTVENIENMSNRSRERVLRSQNCSRVCSLMSTSPWPSCLSCQKIKVCKSSPSVKYINLDEADNDDLGHILNSVMSDAPPEMYDMLQEQKRQLQAKSPNGHRWSIQTIRICLSLWLRNPKAYQDLIDSGMLILPSRSTLKLYKNDVYQHAGFNMEVFDWMRLEANNQSLPPHGYHGGLILDEMAIEEDLQMVRNGKFTKLIGFADCGVESSLMKTVRSGREDKSLANHVLLIQFLGFTGFRFPVAHFPTTQASATDIYRNFWQCVSLLASFGFYVDYTNLDGAITNRQFMKLHFPAHQTPSDFNYQIRNEINPTQSVFLIMDIKHTIKKIRNSFFSSGPNKTRLIILNGQQVTWTLWEEAFKWDRLNPIQIHPKLTHAHISLDNASKMRNHLAEDVLDNNMLNLFLNIKEAQGGDGTKFDGAIALLQQTSIIVAFSHDTRKIVLLEDDRLHTLLRVNQWFKDWESSILSQSDVPMPARNKMLMPAETRQDLDSSLKGFVCMVRHKLSLSSGSSVVPSRINSDCIENQFCQQRGIFNGNNTNPTYRTFAETQNSIILMQPIISKKCNSSQSSGSTSKTTPYSFLTGQPVKKRSKWTTLDLNVNNTCHHVELADMEIFWLLVDGWFHMIANVVHYHKHLYCF